MQSRRAGHQKSRTGCRTCKIRRVKCDETKPYCRRCTDTGRICEGPVTDSLKFRFVKAEPIISSKGVLSEISKFEQHHHTNGRRNRNHHYAPHSSSATEIKIIHPEVSVLKPQHNSIERRAFDYFVHQTAPLLAGAVEDDFWNIVVPCLAQSDPFVWDIIVSIGWLFEYVPYEMAVATLELTNVPQVTSIEHRRALQWYSRALANLRRRIDRNEIDGPFALLSCILCMCIELQQRNVGNAMSLFRSGNKIYSQSLFARQRLTSIKSLALDQVVTPFLSRCATLVATIVTPISDWLESSSPYKMHNLANLPLTNTLTEIRSYFYHIMFQVYEIVRVGVLMWNDEELIQILLPRRRKALDELKRWRATFMDIWSSVDQHKTDSSDMLWLYSHLLMSWDVCYIWLSTCTTGSQMVLDEYMDHFADMLLHAQRLLDSYAESMKLDQQQPSNIETGVISALYFTAAYCRDPVLRRKALQLSRRAPHHESLWANVLMAQATEYSISLEEDQPYIELDLTDPIALAELRARPLPPERRRIQHIAVLGQKKTATGHIIALQLGRITVDANGKKRTVHEDVWLEHLTGTSI